MFSSLREFITDLTEHGELEVIYGVDWDVEIGALAEQLVQRRGPPTVLCDRIKGYPEGLRILINALQTPRQIAKALNFGSGITTKRELTEAWRGGYGKWELLPPSWVDSGPILEHVDEADKVDLFKFPVPKWHEQDGGRYIGTGCAVIQRDPDTGWINVGTYRTQVHDRNVVTFLATRGKDGDIIRSKYHSKGEACPVVICIGQAPDLFLLSSSSVPFGISELELVGGIRGEPVRVTQGQSTGLPIPAEAEIALEGECMPPDKGALSEGPFGEWTGYAVSGLLPEPMVRVDRVYYRHDPIINGVPPVKPPSYLVQEVQMATRIWTELEQSGIPGIQAVNMLPAGGLRFLCAVSIKCSYPGHARQVGRLAASSRTGGLMGRFTIVVDDDIDVYDTNEVLWAMSTRCDPARDIEILEGCWTLSIDTILLPEQRQKEDYTSSRAVIDATRPWHWREQFPLVSAASDEWKQKIREKWGYLFQ